MPFAVAVSAFLKVIQIGQDFFLWVFFAGFPRFQTIKLVRPIGIAFEYRYSSEYHLFVPEPVKVKKIPWILSYPALRGISGVRIK